MTFIIYLKLKLKVVIFFEAWTLIQYFDISIECVFNMHTLLDIAIALQAITLINACGRLCQIIKCSELLNTIESTTLFKCIPNG